MFDKKKETSQIKILLSRQKVKDKYILDDENAIILTNSNENTEYIMIHERLIDGKLIEINKWPMEVYYFGFIHNITPIKELHLFKVQNNNGEFSSLYDYKHDKFVIPRKTWGLLEFGHENEFLKKYNGILGSFSISSDYEEDDIFTYYNQITGKKMVESFCIRDENYYAIVNLDGTIRGNKLLKGRLFLKLQK